MLDLLDYRRRVSQMYTTIRRLGTQSPEAFHLFQTERDNLFAQHPSSPLASEQKMTFEGLRYTPYNPHFRVVEEVQPIASASPYHDDSIEDGTFRMMPFATINLDLPTGQGQLTLYWIMGYGGGVFLPFRDATSGSTTYGGGRYLLDTIKGADLGVEAEQLILDFNYAYHPSCTYHHRWVCPLAPVENRLTFPIPVGEQLPISTISKS
jgi:uncharacterized protein